MKTIILCGGMGTRLREETEYKPKPMVEIGGKPILWHIMKHYSYYGFNEFILALGYKGDVIRDYFFNYYKKKSSLSLIRVRKSFDRRAKRLAKVRNCVFARVTTHSI